MVFLIKEPCTRARVLDIASCPPHDVDHDTDAYPIFYDPLYYPQCHSIVFANASSFCLWLQSSLEDHGQSCTRCARIFHRIAVTFQSSQVVIEMDDCVVTFPQAHFEAASYSHCLVFQCLGSQARDPQLDITSCFAAALNAVPVWLMHSSASYMANLDILSTPVLRATAQRIGSK